MSLHPAKVRRSLSKWFWNMTEVGLSQSSPRVLLYSIRSQVLVVRCKAWAVILQETSASALFCLTFQPTEALAHGSTGASRLLAVRWPRELVLRRYVSSFYLCCNR